MSFCCGASKIGVISDMERNGILIKKVPMLVCPVCQKMESHPKVNDNITMMLELAKEDYLKVISMDYFINEEDYAEIFGDCATIDQGDRNKMINSQIDIALDLLTFATSIQDLEWQLELKRRLVTLGEKLKVTKNS